MTALQKLGPTDPRPPGCRCGDNFDPNCPHHNAAAMAAKRAKAAALSALKCNCGARDGGWHDPGCPANALPSSKTVISTHSPECTCDRCLLIETWARVSAIERHLVEQKGTVETADELAELREAIGPACEHGLHPNCRLRCLLCSPVKATAAQPAPETWMPAWLREFHCQCEPTGEGAGQCVACQAADLIAQGAVKTGGES